MRYPGKTGLHLDFFGFAGGIFLMLSFLPQLIKSVRTRSMGDLSWGLLILTSISGVLYQLYAYSLNLLPVLIMNGIYLLSVLTAAYFKFQFEVAGAKRRA